MKLTFFEKNLWNKYNTIISSINQMEPVLQTLSKGELKEKTRALKSFCQNKSTKLESKVLIESFALVREASRRSLGLRHFDTQLLGGLVLNDNKIAEMRTGEGKTLVATAPALANALSGQGVHIVTVNEYLARRDAEWMGQIYRYLGLNVGLVQSNMEAYEKQKNYNRDITYITNGELGFDYLRDNLVMQTSDLVQRQLNFCIIDEVDSILIDEARTPLIISGQLKVDILKFIKANEVAKYLVESQDYDIDLKAKSISLTSKGLRKTKKLLQVNNIYDLEEPWIPFMLNAIKAKTLFLKDIHYIVKNNEILIIDEFTGRIFEGRRWAEGLHNAIEVKENIYNTIGSETIASITYQNFFRLYPKIAGMTGTAKTEELEFENVYNLPVSVLPTIKPVKRLDLPDAIYIDEISKWKAVANECQKLYQLKRPVLVGTTTIQNSEDLSSLLLNLKVPHELLNAKPENIKRESEIIAQAGCIGSVTIATNMAGRGTDVLLGGNSKFKAARETISILESIIANKLSYPNEAIQLLIFELNKERSSLIILQENFNSLLNVINMPNKDLNILESLIRKLYQLILSKYQAECEIEREKVLNLGGLFVIGTERHESRRIDNQLRGRAGRQGDPGTSRFYLSLNDPIVQIFGGEKLKGFMVAFQMNEEVLESKFLSQALNKSQQKVEGFNYDQRKTLNKYDRILNNQRLVLYTFRRKVLESSSIRDLILEFGEGVIDDLVLLIEKKDNKMVFSESISYLIYSFNLSLLLETTQNVKNGEDFKLLLYEQFWSIYALQELNFWFYDFELFRDYERCQVLKYIDFYWSKHLEDMNFLRDAVTWSAYAQKDPFIQYEYQASRLFTKTFKQCRDQIIYEILTAYII